MGKRKTQPTSLSTELARTESGLKDEGQTVLSLVRDPRTIEQLKMMLGTPAATERFVRLVMTECRQTPMLFNCTAESMASAIFDIAQLGLEPGPLGDAYLVPLKNTKAGGIYEVNFWLGYRGMIRLAYRSERVQSIDAEAIYSKDYFDFQKGDSPKLTHKPAWGEDRGDLIGVYAIAFLRDAPPKFKVLSKGDVDRYRKMSRASESKDGPWVNHYEAMARKTGVRRLAPELPLTIEVATVFAMDEARDLGYAPQIGQGADDALARDAARRAREEAEREQTTAADVSEQSDKPDAKTDTARTEKSVQAEPHWSTRPPTHEGEIREEDGKRWIGQGGGWTLDKGGDASAAAAKTYVCPICGATEDAEGHIRHDDAKHMEAAKAKREAKGGSDQGKLL